jgi:hypothetical protein
MTNSDKHGLPPRTSHRLGQESMAPRLRVACGSRRISPQMPFSRADTGSPHGTKPVCINRNNAAHDMRIE